MSYHADKQVIDTHTDRYTDRGDDNTRRPKLASGKKCFDFLYKLCVNCETNNGPCNMP